MEYYMKKTEMSDVMGEYSVGIRLLRKSKGLTQQELSFMSGISMLTIGKIENGSFKGNISVLERLANVLNRKVEIKLTTYTSWNIS